VVRRFGWLTIFLALPFVLRCGTGIDTLKTKNCTPAGDFATVDDFVYSSGKGSFAARVRAGTNGNILSAGRGIFSDDVEHWIVREGTVGGTIWATLDDYTYPSGTSSGANDILVTSDGNLIAVGYGTSGGVARWIVRKSEDNGDSWTTVDDFVLQAGGNSRALSITRNSAGDLFVTGFGISGTTHWVTRKSTDGGDNWSTIDDFQFSSGGASQGNAIVADTAGNIYAVGSGIDTGKTYWLVRKLINDGASWTTVDQFLLDSGTTASAADVIVDPSGRIFATGSSDDGTITRGITRRTTNAGVTWDTVDNLIAADTAATSFSGLGLDPGGNPYVTGTGNLVAGTGNLWLVRRSSTAGGVWSNLSSFQVAGGTLSFGTGMYIDAVGNFFTSGYGRDPDADRWLVRKISCSL